MPLYPYKCKHCKHEFDDIVKYSKRLEKKDCPKCGKDGGEYVDEAQPFTYSLGRSFSRMRHGK